MTTNIRPKMVMKKSRQLKAWDLRRKGLSYDEIAAELGVHRNTVGNYLRPMFKRAKEEVGQAAEDYRQLALARLDRLYYVAYLRAEQGDLGAIEVCRKLEMDRAELQGCGPKAAPTGNTINITTNYAGLPTDEMVALAQARGIPVPAALLPPVDVSRGVGIEEAEYRVARPKVIPLGIEPKLLEDRLAEAEAGPTQSPAHVSPRPTSAKERARAFRQQFGMPVEPDA